MWLSKINYVDLNPIQDGIFVHPIQDRGGAKMAPYLTPDKIIFRTSYLAQI